MHGSFIESLINFFLNAISTCHFQISHDVNITAKRPWAYTYRTCALMTDWKKQKLQYPTFLSIHTQPTWTDSRVKGAQGHWYTIYDIKRC